jgi:hypothetical protein
MIQRKLSPAPVAAEPTIASLVSLARVTLPAQSPDRFADRTLQAVGYLLPRIMELSMHSDPAVQ